MGVSGQRHAPAALCPRYPLDRRLVGPKAGLEAEAVEKSFGPAGDLTPVQSIVSHYTDVATPTPNEIYPVHKSFASSLLPAVPRLNY
jgi:hypothetical protein